MRFLSIPYRLQFSPILLNIAPDGFNEVIYGLKLFPNGLKVYTNEVKVYPLPYTQNICIKTNNHLFTFKKNNHEKESSLNVIIHCDDTHFL
jgi:hypothetical protein